MCEIKEIPAGTPPANRIRHRGEAFSLISQLATMPTGLALALIDC
jgi:hypothetical protein